MLAGIAGEKGHGFGDVLRFSGMAEWNSFGCGFPLGVGVSRPDPLGGDAAGSYDVGAHAEGGELERQRLRESHDAGFCRRVGRAAGIAAESRCRKKYLRSRRFSDVFIKRGNRPATEKSRGQINVDDGLPVVQRKLFDFDVDASCHRRR